MALKPASFYGQLAATQAGVVPTSTQLKYYADIAAMVLLILADADVPALGLVAPPSGGPCTGSAKIV